MVRCWTTASGEFGDVYLHDVEKGSGYVQRKKGLQLSYDSARLGMMLVKQQVVQFTKYAIETR